MAVDGTGPFESDDAGDFLGELDDDPSLEVLTRAFAEVIATGPGEYLDVDPGARAFAAVDVLVRVLEGAAAERPLRARTLAAVKKAIAAQPAARRAWAISRARAALARATGALSELTDQWDALSGKKKGGWRRDVKRLDALLGRHYDALTLGLAKRRPKTVPKDAVFDREEREWKVEPVDSKGREHGTLTYFRPDGTLLATCTYEHGVATGPWARYHESGEAALSGVNERGVHHGTNVYVRSKQPTSELGFDEVNDVIARIECDYVRGALCTTRWFDAQGHLVTPEGERWPPRPAGVPKEATFNGVEGWVAGGAAGGADASTLTRHGPWRFWNRDGKLVSEVTYDRGRVVKKSK